MAFAGFSMEDPEDKKPPSPPRREFQTPNYDFIQLMMKDKERKLLIYKISKKEKFLETYSFLHMFFNYEEELESDFNDFYLHNKKINIDGTLFKILEILDLNGYWPEPTLKEIEARDSKKSREFEQYGIPQKSACVINIESKKKRSLENFIKKNKHEASTQLMSEKNAFTFKILYKILNDIAKEQCTSISGSLIPLVASYNSEQSPPRTTRNDISVAPTIPVTPTTTKSICPCFQ